MDTAEGDMTVHFIIMLLSEVQKKRRNQNIWLMSETKEQMEFILIRLWEACENTVRPQPGDWTKAPGSLHSPCLHKQPFVPWESWEVKTTDFEDWVFLRVLEWIRPWSNSESSFACCRVLLQRCSLGKPAYPPWLMSEHLRSEVRRIGQIEKKKKLDGGLWWNQQQRLKGRNKTGSPVCQLAQSLWSYCAF